MLTRLVVALAALAGAASARSPRRSDGGRRAAQTVPRDLEYDQASQVWCGPQVVSPGVTSVEASWTIPNASIPSGGDPSAHYWFSHWVGIDGQSPCPVLLQGGTEHEIKDGEVTTFAWYEFWPSDLVRVDVKVREGDEVYVKVEATSDTTGDIYMENRTTGQSNTYHAESQHGALCYDTAEWIAEAPGGVPPEPFPAFTTFGFDGCKASDTSGRELTLADAGTWALVKDGDRMCHAEMRSDSEFTVYNS